MKKEYKLYINGRDFYMPGEFTADNNFDGLAFDSGLPFVIGQDGTGVTGASASGTVHKMPGSGDDNHMMLYIFLMAASLLGLSAVLLFGTRRRRR